MHAVSLLIGSACRSIFFQTLCCLVGLPRELYPQMHDFLFYINLIIPYSFQSLQTKSNTVWSWMYWWVPPFYLSHCNCDWLNHTYGPTEMVFVYHVVWSLPSCFQWTRLCVIGWTIPRGSTQIQCSPGAWNLTQCCFIFFTQYATWAVWSQIHGYISPYTARILLSWKTKNQFVFFHINLSTLVTFTFTPCKLCKMFAQSQ